MEISDGLTALTQTQLDTWAVQARTHTQGGQLPDYIPLLTVANPSCFTVQIQLLNGQTYTFGNVKESFVLMSVVKPFVLLFLLEYLGIEAVFERVGMEPSDQPFNSLLQLETDGGWPRNPMINSGAIVLASMLPGRDGFERCENLRQWLNHHSNISLTLDKQMLISVISAGGERNRAIAQQMVKYGYIEAAETALDTYNHLCCLSGTIADLVGLGMLLAQERKSISSEHCRTVNALMTTCGLYQASGRFAVRVGLPTKSGVSGAILSVVPGQGAIACYSPSLDQAGNSLAGLFFLEQLAQSLNLSVFK